MPIPGPIRKEILAALGTHILPALWQRATALGCAAPPWRFPATITPRLIAKTVPRPDKQTPDFPLQSHWPRAKLHSSFYPYFGFIYEGIADERTLITTAQAKKHNVSPGIYALRWQAPSVLLFPAGTPRNAGDTQFWQGEGTPPPLRQILWISVGPAILVHTHRKDASNVIHISHSLQINDPTALTLVDLFIRELQNTTADEQETATAILLALMLRLQNELSAGRAKIANTSRSPIPSGEILSAKEHTGAISRDAAIFIQMHLHEPLTLSRIANRVNLSPAHLNRLFHRFYGVSVMRYVREQRVAAARKILEDGSENIAEITALLGFKRASAFCDVFRRETGMTPGQFRRTHRKSSVPRK